MTSNVLAKFGIISDTQYADADDSFDFHGIQKRYYRNALVIARDASAHFLENDVSFVVQVGDLLDGKNGESKRATSLQAMREALQVDKLQIHNVVGNHELYLWSRSELLQTGAFMSDPAKKSWYYSFDAHDTLRIIILDSFCESILDRDDADGKKKSLEFLKARNPNDIASNNVDWTKGLSGLDRRFLPYNGAFGAPQLDWLRGELRSCKARQQRALVFTHVPIGVGSCDDVTLNWDFDAAIAILHDAEFRLANNRSLVVAVLQGHCHEGGSKVDDAGILHKTLIAPLICKPTDSAFVRAELFADRLELIGIGVEKSHTIEF